MFTQSMKKKHLHTVLFDIIQYIIYVNLYRFEHILTYKLLQL